MSAPDTTLSKIVANRLCHGCGVCAGMFPEHLEMVDDEELGRRPRFKGERDGAIDRQAAKLCSGAWQANAFGSGLLENQEPADPETHQTLADHWGPVLEVWEGHAADPDIRFKGSSGGAVTGLAAFALASDVAQAVIHTKPDPTDPALSQSAVSRDRDGLLNGAGSRYAPSSPGQELASFTHKADERVVFVGKPCDVAAVTAAERLDSDLPDRIALRIGIFCAGTPATKATRGLIDHLKQAGQLPSVDAFRYRGHGWPGKMTATALGQDGAVIAEADTTYDIGWGKFLQPFRPWRCRLCADHGGEHGDIAVGDPWYDQPTEQSEGRSLIVIRTERGRKLFYDAMAAGAIIADKRALGDIDRAQANLVRTRQAYYGRALATRMMGLKPPVYDGAPLFRLWWSQTMVTKLRDIAGSVKRLWQRGLYRREGSL